MPCLPLPRLRHGRRLALTYFKSDPKSVYSLLCFLTCSSLASVFANYLRSHKPNVLHSRTRGYLSELREVTCPEESHLSFCFPFSPSELLATATNLLTYYHWPRQSCYFMLKHLPFSGMDFLLHIFNLLWSASGRHLQLFSSLRWESLFCSFWPISLISGISRVFKCIILLHRLFLGSNSILFPCQASFFQEDLL